MGDDVGVVVIQRQDGGLGVGGGAAQKMQDIVVAGSGEVVAGRITPEVNFALEPEPGGTGFIFGFVRDSVTGIGIRGAEVFAWGRAGQGGALTESCGGYVLRELRAGAYLVRASARGYYHKLYPDTVFVVEGETTRNVTFLLRPVLGADGGIGGFVFDGLSQDEIAAAQVTAIGLNGSYIGYSDSRGDYVLDGLEPGEYELEVSADGYTVESYGQPVTVETGVITAFISPALYALTGAAEPKPATGLAANDLRVEPSISRGSVRLSWQLGAAGAARVEVLDRAGRLVRTLSTGQFAAGNHNATWDGRDEVGRLVTAGVYFCRLSTAHGSEMQKAVVLGR